MEKPKMPQQRHDLREKRKELHGLRRKLHDRLSEVCEEFEFAELTREHRQKILVSELQYLIDYYHDDANWQGVD
jgi:hypothetical protein